MENPQEEKQPNRLEQTARELYDYVNIRTDQIKLGLVENLSNFFSVMFGLIIFTILMSVTLFFAAAAVTFWLGGAIGSFPLAMVLMGSLFLIGAIVVFALRKKLIANQVVGILSKIFFDNGKNTTPDE